MLNQKELIEKLKKDGHVINNQICNWSICTNPFSSKEKLENIKLELKDIEKWIKNFKNTEILSHHQQERLQIFYQQREIIKEVLRNRGEKI